MQTSSTHGPSPRMRPAARASVSLLMVGLVGLTACADLAASGGVLHFSDCQAGAAAGCVAGSNSNPGTAAAPKRDLSDIDLSTLSGGTTLLFKRGGAWRGGFGQINNPYTSPDKPLTIDAYGDGPLPEFRTSRTGIEFGRYKDTLDDGGYVIRNIKLTGPAEVEHYSGIWLRDSVNGVVIEGVDISGFGIGIHFAGGPPGIRNIKVLKSRIHRNIAQGLHGKASNAEYRGNLIEENNATTGGSNRNHGIYLSGGNNVIIADNVLRNNSRDNAGVCRGGNVTFHGQMTGLLIENNLIEQERGDCYGFSITAGYFPDQGSEYFRNTVVRNNTVVNVGGCSFCISSAPGIVIENNRMINTQGGSPPLVWIPANGGGSDPGDAGHEGAIVRNNVICGPGQVGSIRSPDSTVVANVSRVGAEARTGICAR